MSSLNRVSLLGNVGRDPEIRYTQAGEPIANFSLATTEKWKVKNGDKQEKTQWHRIDVFGKTAEIVRDYVTKGKQLYVEGSIEYEEYEKDGIKKTSTKIKVNNFNGKIVLLGGGGRGEPSGYDKSASLPGDDQITDDDVPF